mgnify:CR=1 FL=1
MSVGRRIGHEQQPPIPMSRVISYELQLFGTHGLAAHSYPALLSEIEAGVLAPQKLIAQSIDLAEACRALPRMAQQPGVGITMIHP